VLVAAAAQALSLGMFARQQRRLLAAFGVVVGVRRMLAITYAQSAISLSLPAGAAVSAGFAFSQFRARGATSRTAATVIVLSGLLSAAALAVLAAASGVAVLARYRWATAVAIAVAAAVGGWHRRRNQRKKAHPLRVLIPAGLGRLGRRWRPLGRAFDAVSEAVTAAAHMRAVDWLVAAAFAALNWVTDLLSLYAATRAVGLTLPLLAVTGGYLAVQVVRQIPITPGGIGVIEASLLVVLVSAGAAHAPAAAAVVVYRALSCWLIVAIGLVSWTVLQAIGRTRRRRLPQPARLGTR
jgi:uncharacterized membrane protein YbhN (UPF0104 family)